MLRDIDFILRRPIYRLYDPPADASCLELHSRDMPQISAMPAESSCLLRLRAVTGIRPRLEAQITAVDAVA